MVHWIWLLFLLPGCGSSGDFRLADLFLTRDQQGSQLMEMGAYEEAAERFESDKRKAYAYVEAGQLEKAMEAYGYETNAEGFYNLGVLYARSGNADAAREAFRTSLELDPKLRMARENLERVDQVLDSLFLIGERERGAPEEKGESPETFEEPGKTAENQEQAQNSDQQYKGQGDVNEIGNREVDESTIDFFDQGGKPAPFNSENARQSMLRRVEEDPSLFLRRKFAYQLRNRTEKPEPGEESW